MKGRWREAIFLLIILPFWSNALVRTFSWTMVLREPFNILFTYPAIVIGLVHAYLPYAILTCYISLQAIDDALIEAGRSLGATPAQAFLRITLPLSMPGVLAAVFLIFVPVIGSFMEPRILGGKDAIMLGPIIEGQFITAFNWPLGAALSFTMLAIVLLILLAATPFLKRQMRGLTMGRARQTYLGLVLVFLYLPIVVMIAMAFNRSALYELPFTFDLVWFKALAHNERLLQASWNSVWIAAVNAGDRDDARARSPPMPLPATNSAPSGCCSSCCFRRSPFPGSSSAPRC